MSLYMKLPHISGNVTTKGYEGWIELEHFDFTGITQHMSNQVGVKQNRLVNAPYIGVIHLIKKSDKSSIALFEYARDARVIPTLDIHTLSTGNPPTAYSKYHLGKVFVSHYSDDYASGNDAHQEYLTLNYETIQKCISSGGLRLKQPPRD